MYALDQPHSGSSASKFFDQRVQRNSQLRASAVGCLGLDCARREGAAATQGAAFLGFVLRFGMTGPFGTEVGFVQVHIFIHFAAF